MRRGALLALPANAHAVARGIGGAVIFVSAALLTALALDMWRVLRVKRRARIVGRLAVRSARLAESPAVGTPTAIGYRHPAVVIPERFRTRLAEIEWQAVLAHETAHLARRDDWGKAVQSIVQRAGWWLPGLWLLGGALDLEREVAADARAVAAIDPRAYAACLLRLATGCRHGRLAPAFARRTHVAVRIERLLRPPVGTAPAGRAAVLGGSAALVVATVAAAVLLVPGFSEPAARPLAARATLPRVAATARIPARRVSAAGGIPAAGGGVPVAPSIRTVRAAPVGS